MTALVPGVMAGVSSGPAGAIAAGAGALTFAAVFVVALAARRPTVRRPQPPSEPSASTARTRRFAVPALLLASAVAIVVIVVGPIGALIVGAVVLAGVARRRHVRLARRQREVRDAMPDAVELLVLCVHAGRSPTQAVVELARCAPPVVRDGFAAVELQLHRGRALGDALGELPRRVGAPGRELAAAIATADRDGLPLAPVLDRLAADARAARRRSGEAAARRLPVQLSFPLVVCTLPSFVLLAIAPAVLGALSTLRGRAP